MQGHAQISLLGGQMVFHPDWSPAEKRELPQQLIKSPGPIPIGSKGHTPIPELIWVSGKECGDWFNPIKKDPAIWRWG